MKLRFTNLLLLLLAFLGCSSCLHEKFGPCPDDEPASPEGKEQYVNLDLRININDGVAPGSRAFTDIDGSFENAVSSYELVHTLRVVIVRADGTVEHNRMVTVKEKEDYKENLIQSGDILNDNLTFKVVAGETKKIYLFANEKAVNDNKEESEVFDFTEKLAVGKEFPTEEVAAILIKRKPTEAFIDNSGNGHKTYIPMSEFFDVTIPNYEDIKPGNSGVAEKYLTETLFITRSLIKFSFSVKLNSPGITRSQLELIGVKISNLANEGYYLPNSTDYDSPKGESTENEGRRINSFKVPYENAESSESEKFISNCTFNFDPHLVVVSEDKYSYPSIYLPESKKLGNNSYNVTLMFQNSELDKYYESKPLVIESIPRNTHVKVNMTLTTSGLVATTQIVPYISVVLDPIFGFLEINPGENKGREEENQPES